MKTALPRNTLSTQKGSAPASGANEIAPIELSVSSVYSVVKNLETRLADLERWIHHSRDFTRAVRTAVKSWPGQFCARDIFDLLHRAGFDCSPITVGHRLKHMERRGYLEITRHGAGPVPTLYEAVLGEDTGVGRPRGKHYGGTSGLICALRRALPNLPNPFACSDVQDWINENWRGKKPKQLNGYLHHLVAMGDIAVARARKTGPGGLCQLYRATGKNGLNGEELSPTEAAWAEFRKTIPQRPELKFGSDRHD